MFFTSNLLFLTGKGRIMITRILYFFVPLVLLTLACSISTPGKDIPKTPTPNPADAPGLTQAVSGTLEATPTVTPEPTVTTTPTVTVTPTPVISRAILVYNRGREAGLADVVAPAEELGKELMAHLGAGEQRAHRGGALLEPVVHALEPLEEVPQVREHRLPGEARERLRDVAAAELREAEPHPPRAGERREQRAGSHPFE